MPASGLWWMVFTFFKCAPNGGCFLYFPPISFLTFSLGCLQPHFCWILLCVCLFPGHDLGQCGFGCLETTAWFCWYSRKYFQKKSRNSWPKPWLADWCLWKGALSSVLDFNYLGVMGAFRLPASSMSSSWQYKASHLREIITDNCHGNLMATNVLLCDWALYWPGTRPCLFIVDAPSSGRCKVATALVLISSFFWLCMKMPIK